MHTLYLLRHAKSDWSDPGLADHDRPLAARGRKAADRMGGYVAELRPRPSLVLCSSARRARETWEIVAARLPAARLGEARVGEARVGEEGDVRIESDLYGAGVAQLVDRIRTLPDRVEAVLMVGHNPGFQDLACELAGDGEPAALDQIKEKFPTGALATLTSEVPWRQAGPHSFYLESLARPRDLAG